MPSQKENVQREINVKKYELNFQEKLSQGMSLYPRHRYRTDTELKSLLLILTEKIQIKKDEKNTVKSFQEKNSEDGAIKQKTETVTSEEEVKLV